MEHKVSYTMQDGTNYELTWDTESGDSMHYLIHENGTLKLECWHHAVPQGWTDEKLKSALVPGTFFNCVARHLEAKEMRSVIEGMDDGPAKQLAQMATRPHMALSPDQEEYLASFQVRGHDVELLVKIMQDAEVEAFRERLDAEPHLTDITTTVVEVGEPRPIPFENNLGPVSAWFALYWPALLWSVVFVAGMIAYFLLVA